MPYIALQLLGLQVVIGAMGVGTIGLFGDLPLIIAFVILAAFTYTSGVALDIVRRPKTAPVHELKRYMRCKDCSKVLGYPYKRSHLVAVRTTKISADDPASTWWPGER